MFYIMEKRMRFCVLFLVFARTLLCGESADVLYRGVTYFCAGGVFETLFVLARLGYGLSHVLPEQPVTKKEWWLFSDLCSQAARLAYRGPCDRGDWRNTWLQNQGLLSQAPVFSQADGHLSHFLQERWLTKMSGISRIGLDWVYPCFGLSVQASPTSNHAYARLPSSHMTEVYKKRVQSWQQELGTAPLILTRCAEIGALLPMYFPLAQDESLEAVAGKLGPKAIVDFTGYSSADRERCFSQACTARGLSLDEIICIQRVQGEGIGGVRILPLSGQSSDAAVKQHDFLLECVSTLGLAASRIELDRAATQKLSCKSDSPSKMPDRAEFLSFLDSLDTAHIDDHKKILVEATFRVLKGLFAGLSEQKWHDILASPTRSFLTWLSMAKIKKQLHLLPLDKPLFEIAMHLEQVHADLSALLEILRPYTSEDFSRIYRDLIALPAPLESLTSYGIHHSGMTCFAAIVKAVEKEAGCVHALYGENTYFECAKALGKLARSSARADTATEEEWQRANLLLVQFNPAVRIDLDHEQYKLEQIENTIRKSLRCRNGAPLTLALDGTLDLIVSPRVTQLLNTFSTEIAAGALTVVVFRSGTKFDLLGMDNYSGAPFFIIRNGKPAFDFLLTQPALQCDPLSLNWFSLAYHSIAPQLEQYTQQIFANTRSLLAKVPKALERKNGHYRIVPMTADADPAFVDIKVTGPLQKIKAAALVIPYLFLESMKKNQPIFHRPSLGFYHPNVSVIFGEECSTVRLTLGLDPAQVDIFAQCFETLSSLSCSGK